MRSAADSLAACASLLAVTCVWCGAQRATVVFVDRMINWGSVAVTDVNVTLLCAQDTPAQRIRSVRLTPRPVRVDYDRWGQRIATFWCGKLAPGRQFVVRSLTDVTLRAWEVDLSAADSAAPIPEEVKALYLADGEKYALTSERIRQAAAEVRAAAGSADPLAIVGAAFDYVVDHIQYSRDGTWDAADKVLERGTGSCSEYVFAFIALCRANGVPARYCGGNARRANAALHIDRVSHRWAEAYLPGVGWAPFDPTRSDGADRYRRYFGRSPQDLLALARGDGGPDAPVRWRYESLHEWSGPDDHIDVNRRGWWFTPVPEKVREQVASFADALPAAQDGEARRRLIARARRIGHPFVLPWLEDLLYDPEVRMETAEAVRDIGGPPAVLPVIDCLERAGDPTGDAALAELLTQWTGEPLDPTRAAWQAWLNTSAFSAFTRPQASPPER